MAATSIFMRMSLNPAKTHVQNLAMVMRSQTMKLPQRGTFCKIGNMRTPQLSNAPVLTLSPPRRVHMAGFSKHTSTRVRLTACIAYAAMYSTDLLFPARQCVKATPFRSEEQSKKESSKPKYLTRMDKCQRTGERSRHAIAAVPVSRANSV